MVGCTKNDQVVENKIMTIAKARIDCQHPEGMMRCFKVKENENDPWSAFHEGIHGFNYEEGYEYVIEVVVQSFQNPQPGWSNRIYLLKRIISKR